MVKSIEGQLSDVGRCKKILKEMIRTNQRNRNRKVKVKIKIALENHLDTLNKKCIVSQKRKKILKCYHEKRPIQKVLRQMSLMPITLEDLSKTFKRISNRKTRNADNTQHL